MGRANPRPRRESRDPIEISSRDAVSWLAERCAGVWFGGRDGDKFGLVEVWLPVQGLPGSRLEALEGTLEEAVEDLVAQLESRGLTLHSGRGSTATKL